VHISANTNLTQVGYLAVKNQVLLATARTQSYENIGGSGPRGTSLSTLAGCGVYFPVSDTVNFVTKHLAIQDLLNAKNHVLLLPEERYCRFN